MAVFGPSKTKWNKDFSLRNDVHPLIAQYCVTIRLGMDTAESQQILQEFFPSKTKFSTTWSNFSLLICKRLNEIHCRGRNVLFQDQINNKILHSTKKVFGVFVSCVTIFFGTLKHLREAIKADLKNLKMIVIKKLAQLATAIYCHQSLRPYKQPYRILCYMS